MYLYVHVVLHKAKKKICLFPVTGWKNRGSVGRAVQYYSVTNILQYFGFQYVLQYVFPYCNNIVFYPLFPLISNLFELNIFMPPAWKVRQGHLVFGSSVRLSVCLSVCPSVRNSVPLINKVQYLKFGWSYSNQTWNVSSSKDCSHFTDSTCPWEWGGVKSRT